MISCWEDEEVKCLFKFVEECKVANKSLKFAFENHAKKYNRKTNSVRNYYYHEVENLKKDKNRCERLKIDLKNHSVAKIVPFSKEEEKQLYQQVRSRVEKGESVRSVCYDLSGGDMTLMTRLQNKFQNIKHEQEGLPDNVITFRQKQKLLTESDINSLFLGLAKLIKKNAVEDMMQVLKLEKEKSAEILKNAYKNLSQKDEEIIRLKEENAILEKRLQASKQDLLKEKFGKKKAFATTKSV